MNLRQPVAIGWRAIEARPDGNVAGDPAIEAHADLGRDGAREDDAQREFDVMAVDVEGALSGRCEMTEIEGDARRGQVGFGEPVGGAANFQVDVVGNFGADIDVIGDIAVLHGGGDGHGHLRLPTQHGPEHEGNAEGEQLPRPVGGEGAFHCPCTEDSRSSWPEDSAGSAGRGSRLPSVRRSRNRSGETSISISPKEAMETLPVSSETTMEMQSASSVTPMAARWRVPSCAESVGLVVSGRKQAAAARRSPWTMTAPSCSSAPG